MGLDTDVVQRNETLVEIALGYAAKGWQVLPLAPGEKRPHGRLVPHGLTDATCDEQTIRRWWKSEPRANIGLRSGIAFDILDLDSETAAQALTTAMPDGADPAVGPTVATPRGWHVYVAPTGRGNTVRLGGLTDVDWRGVGGYVVAAGSTKADGSQWVWATPGDPECGPDAPILPAPAWLLALLDRRSAATAASVKTKSVKPLSDDDDEPASTQTPVPDGHELACADLIEAPAKDRYSQAVLERSCGRLALAPEGTRNDTANREAYGLGRLVGARMLSAGEAGEALLLVAVRVGLSTAEATATIRSGLAGGIAKPAREVTT